MDFDWQTEEDPLSAARPFGPAPDTPRRRRRLMLWGLLLALVLVALTVWQLTARRARVEERIAGEIIASHALWAQAVGSGDDELFTFLLADGERDWRRAQRLLLQAGLQADRGPLGLHVVDDEPFSAPDVTLAPDYTGGELSFTAAYQLDESLGTAEPVRLRQTLLYRRQGERWVQVPPAEAFWGAPQQAAVGRVAVEYPLRDAELVSRLAADLSAELQALCDAHPEACAQRPPVPVRFSADPLSLAVIDAPLEPYFDGATYVLPAPTLVGVPVDEEAYRALYKAYTTRITANFGAQLAVPVPLPRQAVYSLCLNYDRRGLRLERYDPLADEWSSALPGQSFRTLTALPDGSGLVLQAQSRGREANRLRLLGYEQGDTRLLFDDTEHQWQPRPVGWATAPDRQRLMLQGAGEEDAAGAFYRWLDLAQCNERGCAVYDLPGFTAWAPDGEHTLVAADSQLFLGDTTAAELRPLGKGFTPLWLDAQTFAFTRFTGAGRRTVMELFAGDVTDPTAEPRSLFDTNDLADAAGTARDRLFMRHVAVNPAEPRMLLVAASGVLEHAGEYFIFTYRLPEQPGAEGVATLRLQMDGAPSGSPTLLTPFGYPPFHLSPDGRWLVLTRLADRQQNNWTFILHDIVANETRELTSTFPAYPGRFPFYDWSADGQWLVVVDDGFLRLLAPGAGYQRLIPHEFDDCLFTAWAE